MNEFIQTTIRLPSSIRVEVERLAQRKGLSQEQLILQLLEFALSQAPQKQISKGKLPPDLKSDDY